MRGGEHFPFNAFALISILTLSNIPRLKNTKLNMKGRDKFYLKVVFMCLRRWYEDDSLPFRASNSPSHPHPLASLYYSINNQLRLIFFSHIAFLYSWNIIVRNGSHFKPMMCWMAAGWYFGVEAAAALDICPRVSDEVKNHWNRIENAFCVMMETTTIKQFHHPHGDDILNWQFNLLMIHGSLSFRPHVGAASLSEMAASEMENWVSLSACWLGSLCRRRADDDSWWWFEKK